MADFYCIRLINKDGTRGWLIDRPSGIEICIGGVMSDITQFDTEQDALKFIRERKVERGGAKAYVRTRQELMDESIKEGSPGISTADKPVYHLENHKGEKLFYDSKMEAYYFKAMGEFGYPCWQSEEQVRALVKGAEFEASAIFVVKHWGKGQREKTLIQVYGAKTNPDGTMGEPEHIEIKPGDAITNPFDDVVN